MTAETRLRALARLAMPGALLAQTRDGKGYGVFPDGDRRRRPLARLSRAEVRELEASGAVRAHAEGYVLSAAGQALVRRDAAAPGETFLAQHAVLADRSVAEADGSLRSVREVADSAVLSRLARLRESDGSFWLGAAELKAAQALRRDWDLAQTGMSGASDWSAPPMGGASSRGGNARETAMAVRCDARRRIAAALDRLAPPLRRVVERVCIHEHGLEEIERAENWPARSGKLALKLGLAQLASDLAG